MRLSRTIPFLVLAAALAPVSAQAGVRVNFSAPERFHDVEGIGPKVAMGELKRHIETLGRSYLAPGQDLTIEVLDIDLAGELRPWQRSFSDARIVTPTTPPRIEFRYVLRERGRIVRQGHEHLTNMNFQMDIVARNSGEPLAYEKELLTDWFYAQRDFGGRRRS